MYKPSSFRRSTQTDAPMDKNPHLPQAKQLQDAFPEWSLDDLLSLLAEVGDVEAASDRILKGHAEKWGSVPLKKDKRSLPSSHSKETFFGRERGDFRGGRGGRATRGGPRGGAARGASARGVREVNGHRAKSSQSGPAPKDTSALPSDVVPPAEAHVEGTEVDAEATSAWTSSTPTTWGGDTATINGTTSDGPSAPAPAPVPVAALIPAAAPVKVVSNNPATFKLTWAQIARKQTVSPAPAPQPVPVSVPSPPAPAQQLESTPPEVIEPSVPSTEWEEPTTVQAPTWDDEPHPPQQAESPSVSVASEEPVVVHPEPLPTEEPASDRAPSVAPPGIVQQPIPEPIATKPLTPSISTRPTSVSHRTNPKFNTDQPVVLPASFGHGIVKPGSGIEKIGMQFGSLSLGGSDLDDIHSAASAEQKTIPLAPENAALPVPVVQPHEPAASVTSPSTQASASLFQYLPQQQLPQQQLPQPQQLSQSQQLPPQHLSQPPHLSQPLHSQPLHSQALHSQQQHLSQPQQQHAQQPVHTSPQPQNNQQSNIYPSSAGHTQQPPQIQAPPTYGQSHGPLRNFEVLQQPSSPYYRQDTTFNTSTPPVPPQDYGSFNASLHHQQPWQMSNFGSPDYGNPYDAYPAGFGGRNALGHDNVKSLPGSQPPHSATGLPPTATQSSQQQPPSVTPSSQSSQSQGGGHYPPFFHPYPPYGYLPKPGSNVYPAQDDEYAKHPRQYAQYSSGPQQNYTGLGSSGPVAGPPLGQRASAGSPDVSYQLYGAKNAASGQGSQVPQGRGSWSNQPQQGPPYQGQEMLYGYYQRQPPYWQ